MLSPSFCTHAVFKQRCDFRYQSCKTKAGEMCYFGGLSIIQVVCFPTEHLLKPDSFYHSLFLCGKQCNDTGVSVGNCCPFHAALLGEGGKSIYNHGIHAVCSSTVVKT